MVAAACTDHSRAGGQRVVGFDFRGGIGHREDDRAFRHGADHFLGDDVRSAHADEHVGAFHRVHQLAGEFLRVCDFCHCFLRGVHLLAFAQDAEAVHHLQMLHAQVQQVFTDGDAGASGAVDNAFRLADILFDHFQGVDQRCADDYGGAVLVVMEHGDVAQLLQLPLNFEAAGRGDILQVDAAEAAGDQVDRAYDLVHVLTADAQRECVHVAEGFEQRAFSLHDRHAGLRADVAETQHRGTVRDDGHQVVPAGQGEGFVIVFLDFQTGLGDARRIRQGQIVLGLYGNAGYDLDFPLPFSMQTKGFFRVVQRDSLLM